MMYQLTNEQAYELYSLLDATHIRDHGQKASEWLSANLPAPVPVLRPIQEMPPEVPEGCVRLLGLQIPGFRNNKAWVFHEGQEDNETHFIDIRPLAAPDPEAELRREFEKAIKEAEPLSALTLNLVNGVYALREHELAWKLFKAGKEAGCR